MSETSFLYAKLPWRFKASIVDGVIIMSLMIISPLATTMIIGKDTILNTIAMLAPPLLLEPILVSYLGFTIGQYIFGIHVVRVDTHEKCPLLISFARYYVKVLLGSLSLSYMVFSKKHQAIHDHLAKTVVLLSDKKIALNPGFAEHGEHEQPLDTEYVYPSSLKRFGMFILWFIIATIALGIIVEGTAIMLLPGYDFETDELPKAIDVVVDFIDAVIFIVLAVLASKGRLPGAKRIRKEVEGGANNCKL